MIYSNLLSGSHLPSLQDNTHSLSLAIREARQMNKLLSLFYLHSKKTIKILEKYVFFIEASGGQLLEIRLLDTFGRKSTARHKIYQLLESS